MGDRQHMTDLCTQNPLSRFHTQGQMKKPKPRHLARAQKRVEEEKDASKPMDISLVGHVYTFLFTNCIYYDRYT